MILLVGGFNPFSQHGNLPQVGVKIKHLSRIHATSRPAEAAQHGLTSLGLHCQRQVQEIALSFDRPVHYLTQPQLNSSEEIWHNRQGNATKMALQIGWTRPGTTRSILRSTRFQKLLQRNAKPFAKKRKCKLLWRRPRRLIENNPFALTLRHPHLTLLKLK